MFLMILMILYDFLCPPVPGAVFFVCLLLAGAQTLQTLRYSLCFSTSLEIVNRCK